MKTRSLLALMMLATTYLFGQEPQIGDTIHLIPLTDVRTVGAVRVDLTPVRLWQRKRDGERPMKHWKEVQVFNILADVGGLTKCTLKVEDGYTEVLVKNLTSEIRDYFTSLRAQEARIEALRRDIATAASDVNRRNAVTPIGFGGSENRVEVLSEQRAKVNLDGVVVSEQQSVLTQLQTNYDKWRKYGLQVTKELMLISGKKYGNAEIWDCGRKVR